MAHQYFWKLYWQKSLIANFMGQREILRQICTHIGNLLCIYTYNYIIYTHGRKKMTIFLFRGQKNVYDIVSHIIMRWKKILPLEHVSISRTTSLKTKLRIFNWKYIRPRQYKSPLAWLGYISARILYADMYVHAHYDAACIIFVFYRIYRRAEGKFGHQHQQPPLQIF